MPTTATTAKEFFGQWRNPNDVLSVVLIIGSGTVRSALAHLSGNSTFVPVCFSFGWVSFAFENIISMAGEGRLMPDPDYPCKIINAETGYGRENRSWMLGRLLRDTEPVLKNEALCITVWKGVGGLGDKRKAGHSNTWSPMFIMNGLVMVVQLVIAAIPWIVKGDWGVFLISSVGTLLALAMGALPQWRAEKFSCRTNESNKNVLITRGIGTRHVMMVIGNDHCLDMEDLAGGESPRSYRMWQNYYNLDDNKYQNNALLPTPTGKTSLTLGKRMPNGSSDPILVKDLPLAFWITRVLCVFFSLLWICLLISVAGLKTNAWYLLLVGAVGMIQNSFVAGFHLNIEASGLYLESCGKDITGSKVMHVLMELEMEHPNAGLSLMNEFFPGHLRKGEIAWWDAARLRVGERKHAKALLKYTTAGGMGVAPQAPDWTELANKYVSRRAWEQACASQYRRNPFEDLPEDAQDRLSSLGTDVGTTTGIQEKSRAVHSVTTATTG